MITRKLTLINKLGLHARAANKLLDVTGQFASDIQVSHGNNCANAKSIMSVMLLAAPVGSELVFAIEGADEEAAADAIEALITARFDEAE
ncbi:MAG: HPr family phosphocarrier protein [Gammaproteobacteria bacterium]|nr:HPr family phosphocarrier protein [Gammaproteobacteria bacterium]NND40387.1 HPr family phosphocarrier protein [Pseudomonadales bacterium]MBT8149842.1 HPr family phosphocarrier protein [Gammaproteobacteria bacterium]NNL11542.1 HPr family phosphocarrier protein [Pseudomonadales bacterium]NNM12550.1 HPr family phosphocarrier protein [Pseudomonadales bacterium]